MLGVNPLNFDVTSSNIRAKMMVFDANMAGSWTETRGICELNTAFVVSENGREGCGGANNQLGDF
jgi:hypothetical protein